MAASHPYHPLDAEIAGYSPNVSSVISLLATFAGLCTILSLATGLLARATNPRLDQKNLLIVMWFVLSTSSPIILSFGYHREETVCWRAFESKSSAMMTSREFTINTDCPMRSRLHSRLFRGLLSSELSQKPYSAVFVRSIMEGICAF